MNRVVHLSRKAVEPPGEARADLDIFLDFARRMDFRDKDGAPLIKWTDAESAFDAWRECSRGRPCDYSGLSYAKLGEGTGIPWPCNEEHPDGTVHYYADLQFPTDPEDCESYGHDLLTGAPQSAEAYRAKAPHGRAFLRAVEYVPPFEEPDAAYPFFLTTGRVVYHFHTRTKTGRAKPLRDAAPDAFIQVNADDAKRLGIVDGEMLRVTSRRGVAEAPARVGDIEPGTLFIPFHYGYWDDPGRMRAANELTLYTWDPVSKQPHFKYAAVKLEKVQGALQPQPSESKQAAMAADRAGDHSHLAECIDRLLAGEQRVLRGWEQLIEAHPGAPDLASQCALFTTWSRENVELVRRCAGDRQPRAAGALDALKLGEGPRDAFGLLCDLQRVWLLVNESSAWSTILLQAARALGDHDLEKDLQTVAGRAQRQHDWLLARFKHTAAQTVAVPAREG